MFFDLGQFSDPHLVPGALAVGASLLVQSNDPTSAVIIIFSASGACC